MKIDAFILCYNEEKMIRHTLNHYLTFCNNIVIIDNYSTDNTLKIIETEYPCANVTVMQYESDGKIRDDMYLHLKNNIWKKSTADYVIVCDMDEILYAPNITHILHEAHRFNVPVIPTEGYNMYSLTFPENYLKPITNQIKTGARAKNFDKSIIFSPKYVDEINYTPGAHACKPKFKQGASIKYSISPIKLLHYKYISVDYVCKKHQSYAARLSNYNKQNGFGTEYLKQKNEIIAMFELLKTHSYKII